ncbi:hypothetical protein IGI04_021863 [Brassica rapa subsp. trilocularis]|uniref:Uncharacterized protein n=1 Tax=Brassica rapa subsp. trilocularis TaxID=1813537 RepID=A0ABQ7M222_BRACM|nr:hypothetical protein IGI04_021863 [Brassica rapa subsp. trilocularis]
MPRWFCGDTLCPWWRFIGLFWYLSMKLEARAASRLSVVVLCYRKPGLQIFNGSEDCELNLINKSQANHMRSFGQGQQLWQVECLDCKLLKECCSSRCEIEVFRHLELCRKHVAHDLSVTFKGNYFIWCSAHEYVEPNVRSDDDNSGAVSVAAKVKAGGSSQDEGASDKVKKARKAPLSILLKLFSRKPELDVLACLTLNCRPL